MLCMDDGFLFYSWFIMCSLLLVRVVFFDCVMGVFMFLKEFGFEFLVKN